MAQVPYQGAPETQAPTEAPNDYQNVSTSLATFGGAVAEGGQALGQGLVDLSSKLNQAKTLAASNSYADVVSNQQQQFRQLQGQNAIDALPEFKAGLEQSFQEHEDSLPTVEARNQFAEGTRRFYQGAIETAGIHVGEQTLRLQDEQAQGAIQATRNFTVSNLDTPGALDQGISRIAQQTANYVSGVKGERDPDAIHAAVQGQVSTLAADSVMAKANQGETLDQQQQAIKSARTLFDTLSKATIPGSPDTPTFTANDLDRLGQTLNYKEYSIDQRVERQQEKAAATYRVGIGNVMDNATAMVERGVQIRQPLPTDGQINAAYPNNPEQAQIVRDQRDLLASTSDYLGILPEATPAQIAQLRQQTQPDPNQPDTFAKQARLSTALDHALDVRQKALTTDPAGYLVSSDQDTAKAWQAAQNGGAAFTAYAHQMQVSQTTIGIPANRQSLLPSYAAKGIAQDIENDPSAAPQKMQQLAGRYGDYWNPVWRDLVQQGGLSPQFQAVGVIDSANGAILARALSEPGKSGKDVSELLPKGAAGKVGDNIKINPQVRSLTQSILRSGGSAAQAVTVENSVTTLAYAGMAYKGMNAGDATAAAVKAFTGQYRFVPDGGARVPAEKFDTVMSNAGATLSGLSTQNIALPGAAGLPALHAAFLGQESGNRSNVPNSPKGAVGPGQIEPDTFALFARPGEVITNPDQNRAVSARAIDHYYQQYGGDVGRVAVAYFSGPGNVAPPGSPTPWKADKSDGHSTTSAYVAGIERRSGGQIFGNIGGPSGDDYIRAVKASPSWITSPNADALWLMDSYGRVVRQTNGQPVAVPFNGAPMGARAAAAVQHNSRTFQTLSSLSGAALHGAW